jgi:hypothetical protein
MPITNLQTLEVIEVMENFISRNRPKEDIRHKVDLAYRIEDQSIIIYEIRPEWNKSEGIQHIDIAKTTFVKVRGEWKVYWLRADLKWHSYDPKPYVKSLKAFIKLVEDDAYSCFWG